MASTTRRTSAATADRRAAAEARTLGVVEKLLAEGASFTELSVERIASQAGLSRSTFYLYFRDKTELILRLTASLKSGTFEVGRDWGPDGPADGLTWLGDAYLRIIRHYRSRPGTYAAIMEVAGYDRTVREALEAGQRRFIDRVAGHLAEEQRAGRTSPALDPERAARVIVWGGEQVIARHVMDTEDDPAEDARVAHELAAAHWYGTYRRLSPA
ncbi:TetR family transcriptional regulator [Sphaerisporangium melleum]|uniref:TetR family transcriptional regulator n=1 Tax=Sphaerisporangium melleum TaxID=321316 RepID=A0A917QVI9_9ACTN|nr:TetR/AcrR family transcriptional regulator [Sphaerisporangium melleum]GGK69775.1 TetR family transcriptional regulator [Sphaerisporangium melleum]GII70361.1 TetR family transcriptional regulator [Sphaerisporangium melleum]